MPLTQDRLTKALDLVLSNAVLLYPDNTASVNSGSRRYTVANGSCSCADATHRGHTCTHQLAVDIHRRAMALLQDTPAVAANEAAPPAAAVAEPSTPGSAQWDVLEAQTSCYLEFRVPSLKLGYTIRGATDPEVLTRLTQYLPTLQDIIEGYEERSAARQATREAEKAAAAAESSTPGSAQWDVREAPTSCYLEFRVPSLKLGYTIRGATDPKVLTRLTQYLPTIQDIIEGYKERSAARQATREAAKVAAAQTQAPAAPLPSSPAELQQLIQQTLQQVVAAQGSGQAAANGQPPTSVPPVAPEGYCALHYPWNAKANFCQEE